MADVTRSCVYFERPGEHNTARVVQAVTERLVEGDIGTVVVASTGGQTTLALAEVLKRQEGITLIHMGHGARVREWGAAYPTLQPEVKRELEERGVVVADRVSYVFHNSVLEFSRWQVPAAEEIVRDTLYALGQGFKVAVEVALMAVAHGFLEPYTEVIAVGGTERGADTAIVVRATYPNHVLSDDPDKRLRVREILCMPR
jgi:hypothetical protein